MTRTPDPHHYELRALITSRCWYNLKGTEKYILVVTCWFGKKHGEDIFPGQKEIAFRACASLTHVNHTMQNAPATGRIIRQMISIGGSRKRTQYELAITVGVNNATSCMKARFWLPPFKFEIVEVDYTVKLMLGKNMSST